MTSSITPTKAVPVLDDDPFGHAILEDPHDFHHRLREAGPLVHLSAYDVYATGRYAELHATLTDWQNFESGAGVGLTNFRTEKPWRPPSLLLEADPPKHDAPRHVIEPILNPRALRRLQDRWRAHAEQLVDEVLDRRELDLVADLAATYPLRVFPDAVGLPAEGRENLLPYGDHAFNSFGPANDLVAEGAARIGGISAWINAVTARDVLSPNGFGAQIWEAADRGDITHDQAPLIVRSLLTAGVDTTVHGIAALLYCCTENPDQWDRLTADQSLVRTAFDEAVRYESPVQTFFRTATREVEIGDHVVPRGKKIITFLGAANRDPLRWADPDRFDLSRDPSGHVGFGMGIHQCAGQHVARLEADAVISALARRVARFEPTGRPVRHHNNTLRAWESIPVRVIPR